MIIPCLAYFGGNCQDAVILVEVFAVTLKPLGACEGTEMKQCNNGKRIIFIPLLFSVHLHFYNICRLFCVEKLRSVEGKLTLH